MKPLNRPTAEVPPICRVYSASVRRSSRDGRLGKDRRQEGETEGGGRSRKEWNAVGTQRTFELILKSIERHEHLLSRDYPKSPQLPDFPTSCKAFSLTRFATVLASQLLDSMKPQEKLRANLNFLDRSYFSLVFLLSYLCSSFIIFFLSLFLSFTIFIK